MIKIWDVETLAARSNLIGHTGEVKALAIAPQGGTIASGALDSKLKLWRDGLPEAVLTIDDHLGPSSKSVSLPTGRPWRPVRDPPRKNTRCFSGPAPRDGEAAPRSTPKCRRIGADPTG